MKDLKDRLIRLGYEQPDLRENIKPVLDVLTSKISRSHTKEIFEDAANQFAAHHLTELDYDVQQDLMEAISKLHRGRKIPEPKGLLRKLMRERQNISGQGGQMLDTMIHALEDIAASSSPRVRASSGHQLAEATWGELQYAINQLKVYYDEYHFDRTPAGRVDKEKAKRQIDRFAQEAISVLEDIKAYQTATASMRREGTILADHAHDWLYHVADRVVELVDGAYVNEYRIDASSRGEEITIGYGGMDLGGALLEIEDLSTVTATFGAGRSAVESEKYLDEEPEDIANDMAQRLLGIARDELPS